MILLAQSIISQGKPVNPKLPHDLVIQHPGIPWYRPEYASRNIRTSILLPYRILKFHSISKGTALVGYCLSYHPSRLFYCKLACHGKFLEQFPESLSQLKNV
jgi:hypothetical protein